jgi:polysaccharide export outer membrane protein
MSSVALLSALALSGCMRMTVESAVAIAGGFSPRAKRDRVTITHTDARGTVRLVVPTATLLSPGDTVLVNERWF